MEIIVFPYLAVSFVIAWAVFSPFASLDNLDQWTFASIETSDLLAVFIPFGLLLAVAMALIPAKYLSAVVLVSLTGTIFLFAVLGVAIGLYLLAKMNSVSTVKRMAMIGVVIPLGTLLVPSWCLLPLWAFSESILYAIPATLAVIPVTLMLRGLSGWVCQDTCSAG